MAMSDKKRRKAMERAQRAVPDARVTGYVTGRGGANPITVTLAVLGTIVLISGGLYALTGALIVPGVIPALLVFQGISPVRIVIVTDRGIALANPPTFSSRPPKVVATMAHGYVQPTEESLGRVKVAVGQEHVWLTKEEEQVLRTAIFQHPLTQQVPSVYR